MEHSSALSILAGDIVAAYVSHNHVAIADMPALIEKVHGALADLAAGRAPLAEEAPPTLNAAQIRKSVQRDGLISFIDGKPYKTLKRHLTAHGLTPASYRERFGLPADYPMVAAAYSERRSSLAKAHGLGSSQDRDDRLAS